MALIPRCVAHFDLDAFFVSVECLKNPFLKGKPLIVGGPNERGVVAACSYEARSYGVHSAMPLKKARALCPHALVVGADRASYSYYSRMVTDIIAQHAPVYEKASIDEFYLDLTGMEKFFGCLKWATHLRKKIMQETGLPISMALASNKMVAKVATNEVKPNGQTAVPFGKEKAFLAPLPIEKMPMVGEETATLLHRMGIHTIRAISESSPSLLEALLGKQGISLWHKANGQDATPVVADQEAKSISAENTFEKDTADPSFLLAALIHLTEKSAFELRQENKMTGCILVKIRYADFKTVTRQAAIPYTSSDHVLLQHGKKLFQELYHPQQKVRLLGIRFSQLVGNHYQMNLFQNNLERPSLYTAIDAIKQKFGWHYILHAGSRH